MGQVRFVHQSVGELVIDNGLDQANWAYGLNTASFPTYGGEVVQILSVYIDDLTLGGTCATYRQAEAVYSYFAAYFQAATQGTNPTPTSHDSTTGSSYNLQPVNFYYPERRWQFKLYPKSAPGFRYDRDTGVRTWQMTAHVIDDSPDLELIKNGIKALVTTTLVNGDGGKTNTDFTLTGNINPEFGDPDQDPFETYNQNTVKLTAQVQKYADYYNSLIPAYQSGDFSNLTGTVGSQPNFGQTSAASTTGGAINNSATTQQGTTAPASSGH